MSASRPCSRTASCSPDDTLLGASTRLARPLTFQVTRRNPAPSADAAAIDQRLSEESHRIMRARWRSTPTHVHAFGGLLKAGFHHRNDAERGAQPQPGAPVAGGGVARPGLLLRTRWARARGRAPPAPAVPSPRAPALRSGAGSAGSEPRHAAVRAAVVGAHCGELRRAPLRREAHGHRRVGAAEVQGHALRARRHHHRRRPRQGVWLAPKRAGERCLCADVLVLRAQSYQTVHPATRTGAMGVLQLSDKASLERCACFVVSLLLSSFGLSFCLLLLVVSCSLWPSSSVHHAVFWPGTGRRARRSLGFSRALPRHRCIVLLVAG